MVQAAEHDQSFSTEMRVELHGACLASDNRRKHGLVAGFDQLVNPADIDRVPGSPTTGEYRLTIW
jgi:hypothetical protein